jgi:hypothetical protein
VSPNNKLNEEKFTNVIAIRGLMLPWQRRQLLAQNSALDGM